MCRDVFYDFFDEYKRSKEQQLFKTEIFTVTFDQVNESFLAK